MNKLLFRASLLALIFCVGSMQGAITTNPPVVNQETQDAQLTKKIYNRIAQGWTSNQYEYVRAEVKNGIVKLTGSAKTESEKETLENFVRNMEGVKQLDSRLQVFDLRADRSDRERAENFATDTFLSPADEQLNKKIRDQISKGWIWDKYKNVILKTSNGIVTLAGRVSTLDDEKKLVNEIQNIEGVKVVTNNLVVEKF